MLITKTSELSGKTNSMNLPVTEPQLDDFVNRKERGLLVQNIFPHLTPDQREFLLTGVTPEEWNAVFPEEDEDI